MYTYSNWCTYGTFASRAWPWMGYTLMLMHTVTRDSNTRNTCMCRVWCITLYDTDQQASAEVLYMLTNRRHNHPRSYRLTTTTHLAPTPLLQ